MCVFGKPGFSFIVAPKGRNWVQASLCKGQNCKMCLEDCGLSPHRQSDIPVRQAQAVQVGAQVAVSCALLTFLVSGGSLTGDATGLVRLWPRGALHYELHPEIIEETTTIVMTTMITRMVITTAISTTMMMMMMITKIIMMIITRTTITMDMDRCSTSIFP